MTLDEAEKIKNVVENKNCIEQLVNTVAKTLIEAIEHIKIEDVDMFKLGYNKAIDDFAEACKQNIMCQTFGLHPRNVDEIAKQLKAGDSD